MNIRKALSPSQKASASPSNIENQIENKEDEDDKILNEMEELTYAMERKKKRSKKLLAKRRAKVSSLLSDAWNLFFGCDLYAVDGRCFM